MNSLEEEQVAMVEDKFGKKETKPEGKAEAEKKKHLLKRKILHGISSAEQYVQVSDAAQRGSQNRTEGQQGRRNDGQNNRQDGQTQNRDGQNRTGQQGGPRRDGQNGGGRFRDGNNDSEIRARDAEMTARTGAASRGGPKKRRSEWRRTFP